MEWRFLHCYFLLASLSKLHFFRAGEVCKIPNVSNNHVVHIFQYSRMLFCYPMIVSKCRFFSFPWTTLVEAKSKWKQKKNVRMHNIKRESMTGTDRLGAIDICYRNRTVTNMMPSVNPSWYSRLRKMNETFLK